MLDLTILTYFSNWRLSEDDDVANQEQNYWLFKIDWWIENNTQEINTNQTKNGNNHAIIVTIVTSSNNGYSS